jgi:hypothetical protein
MFLALGAYRPDVPRQIKRVCPAGTSLLFAREQRIFFGKLLCEPLNIRPRLHPVVTIKQSAILYMSDATVRRGLGVLREETVRGFLSVKFRDSHEKQMNGVPGAVGRINARGREIRLAGRESSYELINISLA